jgi:carbon storage regulator CsrA
LKLQVVDGNIKVTALNDPQGQVRLGIEAPDDVEIWREEIYLKINEVMGG